MHSQCRCWVKRDRSGQSYPALDFRFAPLATEIARRACRNRREHENYRVSLADQVGEASLPVLATGYAVAVDDTFKAASIEKAISSWSAKYKSSRL